MPEKTVRSRPSPASSVSFNSLSLPSTWDAETIRAMRKSSLRKVVDRDRVGDRSTTGQRLRRFGLGRRFEQGVDLLGFHACHQVPVGSDAIDRGMQIVPAEVPIHAEQFARHALGGRRQHGSQVDGQRPEAADDVAADGLQQRFLRGILCELPGPMPVEMLVGKVGNPHHLAQRLAEFPLIEQGRDVCLSGERDGMTAARFGARRPPVDRRTAGRENSRPGSRCSRTCRSGRC